jgi:hypothetical protein
MTIEAKLEFIFNGFSSFGALSTQGVPSSSIKTMNAEQLQSFNQVFHFNFWNNDLHEIFEEVRYKDDAQINFAQFMDCLALLSRKKYPRKSPNDSLQVLTQS